MQRCRARLRAACGNEAGRRLTGWKGGLMIMGGSMMENQWIFVVFP